MSPIDLTPSRLALFHRDENGAVAVIVSLCLTVLLGFVALGVDVASLYRERAQLQAVTDLTALGAAGDLGDPQTRATAVLARNARPDAALTDLETGRYLRNPALDPNARFTALALNDPGVNAVRVTLDDTAPLHFARIFTEETEVGLTRTALASRTGAASFELTSHIAQLDGTSLNAALADRFGATVSLTAGDRTVLAGATVDLGGLMDALAERTGSTATNPAAILDENTTVATMVGALQDILPSDAAARLSGLAVAGVGMDLSVSALVTGIDTALGLTATGFLAQIDVTALDIVEALIAADAHEHAVNVALDVPGVLSASARMAMGEPPAQSGKVALGETGVTLHRAAVRLLTDLQVDPDLLGSLGVGVSVTSANLSVYAEVAGATATLDALNCAAGTVDTEVARFLTAPTALHPLNGTAVAALYLGEVPGADFTGGPVNPATLGFADLLDLSLVIDLPLLPDIVIDGITIQARSHVALGTSQVDTISYRRGEVEAGDTTRSFGTGQMLGTAIDGLLSPANTEFRVKPEDGGLISALAAPLIDTALSLLPAQLLSGLATPLDAALDQSLSQAGLALGVGELTLLERHCERTSLVQ